MYSNLAGTCEGLCPNKSPKIKRQVASVSKKVKEPPDHNNNNLLSGLQHPSKVKYFIAAPQHPPKEKYSQTVMVKQQQDKSPTSQPHSCRRCCRGKPVHRDVDGQLDHQPVKSHSFQVDGNGATRVQSDQSVSPYSTTTPSKSTIKSSSNNRYCSSTSRTTTPSQSEMSGFLPKYKYHQPQEDQDLQNIITAPTPQELPRSKEHIIYHKPGSIKVSSVENLLKLYPNSFDRLGSLKGEYDITVDSTVLPVQNARRNVPIESKAAIEEAIDYMVKQDILEPQIELTPWVSSVIYPVKPTGEVKPCLELEGPQQSHYLGESQAPNCGGNRSSAGLGSGLHEGRCPQGLSKGTPH